MKELYCGIDIHKESFVGCIMDKRGKIQREHNFPATRQGIESFLCGIPSSQISIVIEACGIWRAAHTILTSSGYKVKLANPLKTHQIACRKKTDKVDAKILADLLRTNYLPEVYIPDELTLQLRDLARHKANLTRLRVKIQAKIKSCMLKEGISFRQRVWNERTLKQLEKLGKEDLNDLIATYKFILEKEKLALRRVRKISQNSKLTSLLMTHPGIGEFGSLMIVAEIADIKRFANFKGLISYAGFCPGIHQSAKTSFTVTNNAVNKWLKWIITECSSRAAMLDPVYMKLFGKVKKRKGFKIARREIGRKMLRTVYFMLKNEEPYNAS